MSFSGPTKIPLAFPRQPMWEVLVPPLAAHRASDGRDAGMNIGGWMASALLKDFHWREAREILKHCRIVRARPIAFVGAYYAIGVLNALLDGVSIVLLVDFVTGRVDLNNST